MKQDCQPNPSLYKRRPVPSSGAHLIAKLLISLSLQRHATITTASAAEAVEGLCRCAADGSEQKSYKNDRGILCTRATFLLAGSQSNTTLFVALRPRAESSHGDPRENKLKPQSSDRPLRTQQCLDTFLLSFLFFAFLLVSEKGLKEGNSCALSTRG